MTCCTHCRAIEAKFGPKVAQGDLRRYRRRGPSHTSKQIIGMLPERALAGANLLDVGGGIGVLAHEILDRGAASAVLVDAAAAYLEVAAAEAERRGTGERLRIRHGDFVTVAADLPPADIVTLDRVVCCYPDYRALLTAAAGRCRKALAISYPRDRWYVRLILALENLGRRLVRDPFRAFVHPPSLMHAILTGEGLALGASTESMVWRMALYTRRAAERAE
jgi:2-polyprenyl-3-methyl-5-hydroxy-6-metoxy-1,4-benzoquinol methylase